MGHEGLAKGEEKGLWKVKVVVVEGRRRGEGRQEREEEEQEGLNKDGQEDFACVEEVIEGVNIARKMKSKGRYRRK